MIPNIFHFVFGLKKQTEEFHIVYYLALKSCLNIHKPEKINFYYKYEPYGPYWDKIKKSLNLIPVEPPTEIFGIPITHYAHQADIIRLQALIEEGGVYADIDSIFLREFPKEFYEKDFVMGQQGNEGLCNALMMSSKGSLFARKWLSDHSICFKGGAPGTDGWCTHSVYHPLQLSKEMPDDIHIAGPKAFFGFLYHQQELHHLFKVQTPPGFSPTFMEFDYKSFHLWENVSWDDYLKDLTEEKIITENNLYNCMARYHIDPSDEDWYVNPLDNEPGMNAGSIDESGNYTEF